MIAVINYLKKISYADCIFYFLTLAIFFVFLMPFMHYTVLNLVKVTSGSTVSYFNDTLAANIYLFIDRYYIFYTVLGVASVAIFLNKRIFSEVIELFSSFNLSIRYAIALFFIFGVISSVFAISPSIAFKGVSVTFLQFFCILFIAVYIKDNSRAVRFFYIIILLSLIFFGGSLFLQLSLAHYSVYGSYIASNIQKVLLYTYNCLNPRFLDNYFSWFMPLLVLPWFVDLRPIYKLGSFIALTLAWFILINHGFRTIFAEYIVILPLLYIFARRYFKTAVVVFGLTLVYAGLLDLFYNYFIAVIEHSNIESSADLVRGGFSGRIPLWKEAFWVGIEHPLTGVGQWNYLAVTKRPDGYPHNLLLEIWSQWGIPAFIAAAIVIITAIRNLYKKRLEICLNPYQCIFMMMLTAGMVDGMLNAMFKTSLGLFGCVFVFGFCLSIFAKQPRQNIDISVVSYVVVGLSIFVSIFCIAILPLIFPPLWI
ncbi:O-antigen ligase family protein [Francisella hispaniensis]|uniref:Type IV pili glycosylation protein n=1 Tax=Francisella hispaniensis FSC454 TaxID=1088883 RepID=A0AAC9J972_9GAMM|nr:O-antigen ligase family protein [Francisella hispaniensis]APD50003.1 type IV pili glycosylation protein [Francisella hispaniensis FSC454]KYW86207.1 type IV pili glycosylation protein [Francisella hispaniensis FSC454]